jgi:hypothetical protein
MTGYPHQTPDGRPVTVCLDWSGRDGVRHYGDGRPRPCRSCGRWSLLLDDAGRPQHKVCAEAEAGRGQEPAREPEAQS